MAFLVDRIPTGETLYPVTVPGMTRGQKEGKRQLYIYLSRKQLTQLRANVAKAIMKANAHEKEEG